VPRGPLGCHPTPVTRNSASFGSPWGVPPRSGVVQGLLQAHHQCWVPPNPLLLTTKDAWGQTGRKGGFRGISEVTAHSRKGQTRELHCAAAAVPSLAVGLGRYVETRPGRRVPHQPAHYSPASPFLQPGSCCPCPSQQVYTEYSQAIQ